jgi:hypothetical protein
MKTNALRGAKNEETSETATKTTEVDFIPSRHFREKYRDTVGNLVGLYRKGRVHLAGKLVRAPCSNRWFLDVVGLGRVVLHQSTGALIGVTLIPASPVIEPVGVA